MFTTDALYNREPAPHLSARYEMMPTIDIVNKLDENGYTMTKYTAQATRGPNGRFAKHVVRFRAKDIVPHLNEVYPEVVLFNSHNGSFRLKAFIGFFRMICANGMVTGDVFDGFTIKHTHRHPFDQVLNLVQEVAHRADAKLSVVNKMKEIKLIDNQVQTFLHDTMMMLVGEYPNTVFNDREEFGRVYRTEDAENTLWNVFNRVQENVVRGNFRILGRNGRPRWSRGIKNIEKDLKINQKLWKLATNLIPEGDFETV